MIDTNEVKKLVNSGEKISEVARKFKVSTNTIRYHMNKPEKSIASPKSEVFPLTFEQSLDTLIEALQRAKKVTELEQEVKEITQERDNLKNLLNKSHEKEKKFNEAR